MASFVSAPAMCLEQNAQLERTLKLYVCFGLSVARKYFQWVLPAGRPFSTTATCVFLLSYSLHELFWDNMNMWLFFVHMIGPPFRPACHNRRYTPPRS